MTQLLLVSDVCTDFQLKIVKTLRAMSDTYLLHAIYIYIEFGLDLIRQNMISVNLVQF